MGKESMTSHRTIGRNSYQYHILVILQREKKPMTAIQLLNQIKKVKKITSKTPDATLRSTLYRSPFVKGVGNGHYEIKSNVELPML